jgi:hypothetical protein
MESTRVTRDVVRVVDDGWPRKSSITKREDNVISLFDLRPQAAAA